MRNKIISYNFLFLYEVKRFYVVKEITLSYVREKSFHIHIPAETGRFWWEWVGGIRFDSKYDASRLSLQNFATIEERLAFLL